MVRLLLLFLLAVAGLQPAFAGLREQLNINRDWKFELGEHPGAEAATFDDAAWGAINLPHSFSLPYFQDKNFYVGYGWYRKHFQIEPDWASKRITVEFEAAFQDAEVFVNGTRIGEHKGGFTGFSMDITAAVHPGDNVLAVRLNNNWNAQIEPRSGDHTFMGGIYRNVHLVVTDPLHVTWYGTFVTTPRVAKDAATVEVKTEIANESAQAKNCTLVTELIDPGGKSVARLQSSQPINPGATVTLDQISAPLPSPQLWDPSHPFLYQARTTVSDAATPVDDFQTTFGIRSIKWTADQGFFINGGHHYFHGANVHQDHAGWGDAVTSNGARRDVRLVKEAGLDFIRGSHYPHHPAFADACDELGVLFWSENCFWGMARDDKDGSWLTADPYPLHPEDEAPFEQNALDTLRDEIRIFRNHPSIIAWSMCNEVFVSNRLDKTKVLLTRLVNETHQLDPTRPAAIGGAQRGQVDRLGDVAGYNGDGARLPEFQNPGIANAVTEYGSYISDRPGVYSGQFNPGDLNENTPEYSWRSGQSLWCAFDYSTILGHFGCMGFVDYFRIPKRSWYWYRNEYRHVPPPAWPTEGTPARLDLTADQTTIAGTNATDDCQLLVTVEDAQGKPLSNSPPVTFTIISGPGEFPTGRSIGFHPPSVDPQSDIAIRDGKAAMEFRSYFAGTSVIRATSPGLQEGTVTITTTGSPIFTPGQSPLAPDRPYVRFTPGEVAIPGAETNIAVNRPASASSEAPGHVAGQALDGNPDTFWQAKDGDPAPSWQVDLESLNSIATVELHFGHATARPYRIEASPDGHNWVLLADRKQAPPTDPVVDSCAKNDQSRYLRVTFSPQAGQVPVLLSEVEIRRSSSP